MQILHNVFVLILTTRMRSYYSYIDACCGCSLLSSICYRYRRLFIRITEEIINESDVKHHETSCGKFPHTRHNTWTLFYMLEKVCEKCSGAISKDQKAHRNKFSSHTYNHRVIDGYRNILHMFTNMKLQM